MRFEVKEVSRQEISREKVFQAKGIPEAEALRWGIPVTFREEQAWARSRQMIIRPHRPL